MPRTTENAVRDTVDTSLGTESVEGYIADANLWVTEELGTGKGLTASRLELIERYLACALIRIRDLGVHQVKIGDITEHYTVDKTVNEYMLKAAAFDPTGTVKSFFLPQSAGKRVLWRRGETFQEEHDAAEAT